MTSKQILFVFIIIWFIPEMYCSNKYDITGTYMWEGEKILLTEDSMFYYDGGYLFDKGKYSISERHILFVSDKGEPKTVPIEVETIRNNSTFSTISVMIVNKYNEREQTLFNMGKVRGLSPYGGPFKVENVTYRPFVNGKEIDDIPIDPNYGTFICLYKPIYTEIKSVGLELFMNISEQIIIGYHAPFPIAMARTPEYLGPIPVGNNVRIKVRLGKDDFNSSILYGYKFKVKKNCLEVTDRYGHKTKFKKQNETLVR